jgi:hypothetical protein
MVQYHMGHLDYSRRILEDSDDGVQQSRVSVLSIIHYFETRKPNVSQTGFVSILKWRRHLLCWVPYSSSKGPKRVDNPR